MDLLKTDVKALYRQYLVPSLSAAVVTSVYSFVDMIAIGRGVGPAGAAALSIVTPIFGVVSFLGLLCGVGGSVYVGIARGEGNMEKSSAHFTASLSMSLFLTVLAWSAFLMFSEPIYRLFGANEALMPFVKEYTDLIVWTMPFFILSPYLTCMVRSDGAPNLVMGAVVIGGMFNVFGDWFFVFPMKWGMFGTALATVMGTVMQFIVLCSHFFSKRCRLKFVKPLCFSRALRNVAVAGFSAGLIDITNYANLTKSFGAAKDCIACGQCEEMCPQHFPAIWKVTQNYLDELFLIPSGGSKLFGVIYFLDTIAGSNILCITTTPMTSARFQILKLRN